MPRPGPRPYECVRRAWHSDSHQPLRGGLTQEIFRIVTEFHSPETRSKKEWQEKLPIVVLRAEEILYSKARTEAEYTDISTLKSRLQDAVNTMIRRTDDATSSSKDGPYMEPCVEAALSLGCTPKSNPRGQRPGSSSSSSTSSRLSCPASLARRQAVQHQQQQQQQQQHVAPYMVTRNDVDPGLWSPATAKLVLEPGRLIHAGAPSGIFGLNRTPEFDSWQTTGYHHQQRLFNGGGTPSFCRVDSNVATAPPSNLALLQQRQQGVQDGKVVGARSSAAAKSSGQSKGFPSCSGQQMPRVSDDELELCLAPPKGSYDMMWQAEGKRKASLEDAKCWEARMSSFANFEANKRLRAEFPY